MLDTRAVIAALHVHYAAILSIFLRGCKKTVDTFGIRACGAADEHGGSPGIVLGDGPRGDGGIRSSLQVSEKHITQVIKGDISCSLPVER